MSKYLKLLVAKTTQTESCMAGFESGQPQLESMTKQLKANGIFVDNKNCYKTDGLITLFGVKNLELLLLETSGKFGNTDQVKLRFDHHKAVFGLLAMLKTMADEFYLASIQSFPK